MICSCHLQNDIYDNLDRIQYDAGHDIKYTQHNT